MAFSFYSSKSTEQIFLDETKRRKWYFRAASIGIIGLLLVCLVVAGIGFILFTKHQQPFTYQDAIQRYHYYYSGANTKKIALTIDDGPNPRASDTIVQTLSDAKVPATFFYIGEKAFVRPDLVHAAAQKGFDIEVHSFTHGYGVDSSRARLSAELDSTGYLLQQITNTTPRFYRPPFLLGIGIDPTINPYIPVSDDMKWTLEFGYLPVGSDIDPRDWLATTPEQVLQGLADALQRSPTGHIVLLHEDVNTAKAMPQVISYLQTHGYQIVPLSELITPPTEIVFNQTFGPGATDAATGGAVSKLQWFLYTQKYLDAYALSGVFGSQTTTAVINFKTDHRLVNAADPASAPFVDPATRALIHSMTTQPAPAVVPVGTWDTVRNGADSILSAIYVTLFPFVSAFLAVMVFTTLLLVIARLLALFGLLVWGKLYPVKVAETSNSVRGVSILIPAYNEEENIGATIMSAAKSLYRPFEIIVINDGSTDQTSREAKAVIDTHPNEPIKLLEIENGGKARALNMGMEVAQYDIIVVLDADAVLHPQALNKFVRHFEDPAIGAVAGKICTTNQGGVLDLLQSLEYAVGQNIDKKAFSVVGAVGVVPGPAGAWRRSLLKELGGFKRDTLVEDQDMTLSVLRSGSVIRYEPEAISFTETPHSLTNFLKQRFRWVFGTMQCFVKHQYAFVENPTSPLSVVVLPNIFVYNILLPLTYPFADFAFLFGILTGQWHTLVIPFIIFSCLDICYAAFGLRGEKNKGLLLVAVLLQRIIYRPLLYFTVARSIVRAIEGGGTMWNKFTKAGETKRFYQSLMDEMTVPVGAQPVPSYQVIPEEVMISFQGPTGTTASSTNFQDVVALSVMPRQSHNAGETSSPAWTPNVLTGFDAEPNTYAKSSSPFGPTSSH